MLGYQFGRQPLDVAQQQCRPFPLGQDRQSFIQIRAMLRAQNGLLGGFGRLTQRLDETIDLAEVDLAVAPQKIDGRIAGNAREPVRRLVQLLQLILTLESLNEGLLGEILGIVNVADNAIDEEEDAA